ncbi:MAG: thermonuclease family protein [Syntrophobacteraceae bacterium]
MVRLYEIHTPEAGQPFYDESKFLTSSFVPEKLVEVIPVSTVSYGTIHALVRATGKKEFINEQLLGYGMAWVDIRGCRAMQCKAWEELQQLAKTNRIGIWIDRDAVSPWEWKKNRAKEIVKKKGEQRKEFNSNAKATAPLPGQP